TNEPNFSHRLDRGVLRTAARPNRSCADFNCAHFIAPHLDARANFIANFACAGEAFFLHAAERTGIWKTPVQSPGHTGKNWASLGTGFIADRDHVGEQLARFEDVEHGLSLLLRNINPDLAHRFHRQRVELSRFEPGTVRLELDAANLVEKRFRNLTPSAVMNKDV